MAAREFKQAVMNSSTQYPHKRPRLEPRKKRQNVDEAINISLLIHVKVRVMLDFFH